MATYRVDLAYDGAAFHGYARQPNVATVQGALEEALARHLGPVETFVAGRTDKGVHATGQVASFTSPGAVDAPRLVRSLNKQLAPSIAVLGLSRVDEGFHARHSAVGRRYRYLVLNRDAPDPFLAPISWHVIHPLDLEAMQASVLPLLGEHDFASLCRKAEGRSTVRELRSADWLCQPAVASVAGGDLLALDIAASSFCHQMVRSIVALSVDAGRGAIDVEAVAAILAATDRTAGRGAAPPHGLTLVAVDY